MGGLRSPPFCIRGETVNAYLPDFDALAEETAGRLAEYLRIDTINPPGNERAGAEFLKRLLDTEGIDAEIHDSDPGRGNLYARLAGTGGGGALLLLSHIDVVPATAEAWSVPPLSGTFRGGYVWGRGALDMKGMGMVELMTMVALRRRGIPLERDLVLVANADEEAGSTGARWFSRERGHLLHDVEFVINEGGENPVGADGRTRYYGIELTEKLPLWLKLTARGAPGHGSRPTPANAVARLARALGRLAAWETPLILTEPVEEYLRTLAAHEPDPARRSWLADPTRALDDAEARAWLTGDRYLNALLRNTVSITGMSGSDKVNLIPPLATAQVDVRLLPGTSPEEFLAQLRTVLDDDGIDIERTNQARPTAVAPFSGPVVEAVRRAVEVMDPGTPVTTQVMTGYSDSCYYRELGIAAYGLDPFRTTPDDLAGIHGNDERVSLANIRFGVEFMYRVVESILSSE